jgi:hypothetical protein
MCVIVEMVLPPKLEITAILMHYHRNVLHDCTQDERVHSTSVCTHCDSVLSMPSINVNLKFDACMLLLTYTNDVFQLGNF